MRVNGNSLAEGPDAFVRYAFLEKGSSFTRCTVVYTMQLTTNVVESPMY